MSDSKLLRACQLALLASVFSLQAVHALDIGFDSLLSLESSDNVAGVNAPDEEDGVTAGAVFGVYGEQRSPVVDAAFSGELDTRKLLSEEDSSFNTVSRFLGAAEISLTPRSWRWYVGDILGGVRQDDAIQVRDNDIEQRRNVFVTGPSFEYDVEGRSRLRSRLLYVSQSQENEILETLYNGSFSYERETTLGSYFGFRAGDIYTDVGDRLDRGTNFNRATASVYWNRLRGPVELYGEMGITRYDTDEESLNGLNARLRATLTTGPLTTAFVSLDRDLNDQTLTLIENLIDNAGVGAALQPDISGFFATQRLTLGYSFQATRTSLDLGAGVSQIDYQLLASDQPSGLTADGEDRIRTFAYGALSQRLTNRLRGELGFSYEQQDYDNREDESDSLLASAQLIYTLTRSLELSGRVEHDVATGRLTRVRGGELELDDIDVTENRFTIGLRWAPPSRASRDLTVELKSLLQ